MMLGEVAQVRGTNVATCPGAWRPGGRCELLGTGSVPAVDAAESPASSRVSAPSSRGLERGRGAVAAGNRPTLGVKQ